MINTGRNCGNGCFLGQVSVSSCNDFVKARVRSTGFAWSEQTSILCARAYMIYSGNFCKMAKMVGNTTCVEVAEMCANDNINGSSLPKDVQVRWTVISCICVDSLLMSRYLTGSSLVKKSTLAEGKKNAEVSRSCTKYVCIFYKDCMYFVVPDTLQCSKIKAMRPHGWNIY